MLKFKSIDSGFRLFYKDYFILEHSSQNPCVKVGSGKGKFKSHHGHFKIKEKDVIERELREYEILSQEDNNIEIRFGTQENLLEFSCSSVDDRLEMKFASKNKDLNRFWIKMHANDAEAIYGCGEQFSEVNLRGKKVPLWVEEQGVGRGDPPITGDWYTTYFPQPTFISSENYYLHSESLCYAIFDFTHPDYHELYFWNIPDKIIIGKYQTALDTVSRLSKYLGRQPKLPEWVYDGVWLGIQGGENVVIEKVKKCLEKGVNVGAVWCQDWQGVNIIGPTKRLKWNWEYDNTLYPDLPSFIKTLNGQGIKFLGYINSMLAPNGSQYGEALEKDLCVKEQNGDTFIIVTDSGDKIMLDLSNPDTLEWLKNVIKENMINIGLSGWMADYGEYIPTDIALHSGEDPKEFHNKYPVIFAKANIEAIKEAGRLGDIVFFTRAGYSHVSRYTTQVWAGDQLVNWSIHDGIATVIAAGISLGICGIGYFHYDIGGFHALQHISRDKEIFMRWAEMAVFTTTMRTHESIRPIGNWQFDSDDETLEFFAKMSQRFTYLKPYMQYLSNEYIEKGFPPIRACYLHYENDPELHKMKYQYLFGQDLLVAPVIKPNSSEGEVYFPDDIWIHIWSGKEFKKGFNKVKAPIGQPPVFYRKDSNFSELFSKLKDV
ncbi:MAG: alpha-glucosidase [Promethearchaeota archaeon]